MTEFDLVIVGVGGQGTILASDIVGMAAVNEGLPVQASETHGMAQRGGSVINHVRLDCRYGSLIPAGRADAVLGLEPAEGLRAIDFLSRDGVVVVNTNPIFPITVLSGASVYPEVDAMLGELKGRRISRYFQKGCLDTKPFYGLPGIDRCHTRCDDPQFSALNNIQLVPF